MDREHRPGQSGILALGAAVVAAIAACGDGGSGTSTGSSPPPSAAVTSSSPAGPATHAPKRMEGSAAALSVDGQRVFVADEDHEVVFVAPVSFADLAPL